MTLYEISDSLHREYKEYYKTLAKYGVYVSYIASLQADILNGKKKLVCTTKSYRRTASGRFSSVPYESESKEIQARNYLNIISSIPMFGDRVKKQYTAYGYIPMTLTCFRWGDAAIKKVREFEIITL